MYLRIIKILILTVCVATQSHGQKLTADEDRRTASTIDTKMPVPIETTVELPIGTKLVPRVVLLLHLDANGDVLEAKVAIGEEPFASIALGATKRFQFVPALKNGVPTECRFLFEISWQIPTNTPSPTSISNEQPLSVRESQNKNSLLSNVDRNSRPKPSTGTTEHLEVIVQGVRVVPSAQTLTAAEAREIPATFGDPLRAIEILPGVTPVMAGLPYFYVRGAPPGNVGYFVDGVRVPLLWHALVGPSVIHPATLDKVTIYRGGYPANYGRYAGAIVTADTVSASPESRGEAGIRLVDASLMLNSSLGRLSNGVPEATALVSGRYSYAGLAVSLLSNRVDLGYWDYQTLAKIPFSKKDDLSLLALGAYDYLATTNSTSSVQYHRVDLRYDHRFSSHGGLRVALTAGHDNVGGDRGNVRDNSITGRLQFERYLHQRVVLQGGLDTIVDYYTLDVNRGVKYQTEATLEALMPTRREVTAGAYVMLHLFPTSTVQVTPGVRSDFYTTRGAHQVAFDPRISSRIQLSKRISAEHTIGLASQATAVVPGVPAAQMMSLNGGLQRSIQASSGISYQISDTTQANLTLFDNIYQNLSDPLGTSHRLVYDIEENSQRVRGASYGAELYIHRRLHQRIGGFVSYTLSRSTRSHATISTLAALDRTHVINAALAFDLGRHWRFGVRGTYLSGLPIREATTAGDFYHGGTRAAPFFRLDLRAEKRWIISPRYYLSFIAELLNATLSQEVTERSCNVVRCIERRVGPIVMPSIGVEAHF
jgi:hypothetical protein